MDHTSLYDLTDQERRVIGRCLEISAAIVACDTPESLNQSRELDALRLKVMGNLAIEHGA